MSSTNVSPRLVLQCKDCLRTVTDSDTVAYRLVSGVFFGWCEECFNHRHDRSKLSSQECFPPLGDHGRAASSALTKEGVEGEVFVQISGKH